jgi:hypothetical protein
MCCVLSLTWLTCVNGESDRCLGAAITLLLLVEPATGAESKSYGSYDVTTEIMMPHLDENLRYAITRQRRCLDHQWLSSAFPARQYRALSDCTLNHERWDGDTISYTLSCTNGHGTTGTATWRMRTDGITGQLNVTLGGKNMKFSELISARRGEMELRQGLAILRGSKRMPMS